jgi:hypothetical protein
MSVTFSVNVGTQFESTSKGDIISVLKELPDNTNKLISPKDVRDAFLTTWASSPIKQTISSNGTEYIGIDSGNPANRDIKQKIFLGKRSFGNLDIMTSNLLGSSTADIYVYNTKPDSSLQDSTTMAFLAGTNSSVFIDAPYIGSTLDSSRNALDFNIRNPQANGGSINMYSDIGYVAFNGIRFPKVSENASATNGKILRYVGNFPNGYLKWDDSSVTLKSLGSTSAVTNIYGGTVSLNGYELEFVSDSLTSTEVGGIPYGFSFSATSFDGGKWPLSEVIRKLLYPKRNPLMSVTASNSATGMPFAELGTTSSVTFRYDLTIYPRNEYEYISDYIVTQKVGGTENLLDRKYSGLSFSGKPGSTFSGTITGLVAGSYSTSTTTNFLMNLSDIWVPTRVTASSYNTFGFSYSATASVQHIVPIYYGFTSSAITNTATFNNAVKGLNKYIAPYPGSSASISLDYRGSGYLYFIHQSNFPTPISRIYDSNGFIIHDMDSPAYSSFASASNSGFLVSGTTPNGVSTQWKVWRTDLTCSYDGNNKFTFRF